MNMKNAIKIAAFIAIAASAFAAANPAQADDASQVEELVKAAENKATVLKWAISIEGSADGTTRPWIEYNSAKEEYFKVEAAVDKLGSGDEKTDLEVRLADNVWLHVKRAMHYIDAITAGEKIVAKQAALEAEIADNVIDADTADAYFDLNREIRKQAFLLDRVYGKSTRDAIRAQYKYTAEAVSADARYPVSIHIEIGRLDAAIEAGNEEEAAKRYNNIVVWLDKVSNDTVRKNLADSFAPYADEYGAMLTPAVKSVSSIYANQIVVF